MKLSLPAKQGVSLKDANRSNRVRDALAGIAAGPKQSVGLSRQSAAASQQPLTKFKLNIRGDRRGMHNQENPPSGEEMARRRAMRRIWNKKMPALQCSQCQFSSSCPQFKAGYECAFLPFFTSHRVESTEDLRFYMRELLSAGVGRMQQLLVFERMSGATPSVEGSESLAHLFQQMSKLYELEQEAASVEVETNDLGLIAGIFGNLGEVMKETRDAHRLTIDVPENVHEAELAQLEQEALRLTEKVPAPQAAT